MQSETKYTKQDLETMRAWSLQRKIQVTQTRIIEWIGRYDWNVYISFSGGKDSTVLADLTARAYQAFWCPNRKEPLHLVFVNTGLEYPEIQKFVKYFAKWLERQYEIPVDLKVLTPELTFPEVLTKYGYPVIGERSCKGDLLRPARFTMGTKPAGRAGQARKAKQIQGTLQEVQVHGRGTVFNFAIML